MKGNKRPEVGERGREGEERERTRGRRDWDGVARGGGERGVSGGWQTEERRKNNSEIKSRVERGGETEMWREHRRGEKQKEKGTKEERRED